MKKLIGLLLVLVVAYFGAVAFIGSKVDEYANEYIAKLNQKYAYVGIEYKAELVEKTFFGAKYKMMVDYTNPNMKDMLKTIYQLPFTFDIDIEFGPLLCRHGFGLGYIGASSLKPLDTFIAPELYTSIFKDAKINLDMTSKVSFLKHLNSTLDINKISFSPSRFTDVVINPISMVSSFNINTFIGDAKLKIPSIKISDSSNDKNSLTINDTVFDMDVVEFINSGIVLGDFELSIDKLDFKTEFSKEFIAQTDVLFSLKENSKNLLDTNLKINYKNIKGQLATVKIDNADISLAINSLDKQSVIDMHKYVLEIQDKQMEMMNKFSSPDANSSAIFEELDIFIEEMQANLFNIGKKLLIKDKTNIKANININHETHVKLDALYIASDLPSTFNELILDSNYLLNAIKFDFDAQVQDSITIDIADYVLQGLLDEGFATKDANLYKSKINYYPVVLMINDSDKSELLDNLR